MILSYKNQNPDLATELYIAETAAVIGDVTIADGCSVWHGASVRGDEAHIEIGEGSNVQDNATLHCDTGVPLTIGKQVSVGHNAVVHSCTIGDGTLIGMGAVVLSGAVIGEGCVIAAGAVVREGTVVPDGTLMAGVPAVSKGTVSDEMKNANLKNAGHYRQLMTEYSLSHDF